MNRELFDMPELGEIATAITWKGDSRKVVYHGTRFGQTIMDANALIFGARGLPMISFTSLPRVAAYWALMERPGDEGRGTASHSTARCSQDSWGAWSSRPTVSGSSARKAISGTRPRCMPRPRM